MRQALRRTDPDIDSADIERYLHWLLTDDVKPQQQLTSCDANVLLSRLRGCDMRRAGRKP